jgi:type I restriction enzyme M protein
VNAILRAKRVDFAEVLTLLGRDELKAVCEALGLDTSGRDKQTLLDRVLGRSNGAGAGNGGSVAAPSGLATGAPPDPAAKLTREQLEGYLWAAADILRGSIDSSDYKNFIFGLLFLKRLSDRFEEECEQLVAERANPEDPDEHQFFVPKRARWSQIQKGATGLGELLNKASAALEEANAQALEGVLAGTDFNDERKLGDARQRDNVLHRLVLHFSKINLRNDHLAEPDMLGRAYEYLIEKFADDAGKKGGEFYTPHMVVRLIVELLEPKEGMRICDPTCGSGGMLIQAGKYIVEHGGRPHNFSLFGQEKNLGTWAICKMNMLLHGYPDARIEKGDVIRDPKLLEGGELMLFDRVIANPPFSLDAWGQETAAGDSRGRFRFGVPPKTRGDLAFVQHMVATLNAHGKMGVVMPHGVLFRGASEGEIRKGLLQEDLIEAVVGLPTNLFYGTGIPAAILVINRDKPKGRKGKVLFVDASNAYEQAANQNRLRLADVQNATGAVRAGLSNSLPTRFVDRSELEANDFILSISRYVGRSQEAERIDVRHALEKLRAAGRQRDAAQASLDKILHELGYEV